MPTAATLPPEDLRAARKKRKSARPRDLADSLGVPEAALVAALIGPDTVRIDPAPERLLAAVADLGPVMGLTRNAHCVVEHSGRYGTYTAGQVRGAEVTLDLDPARWAFAFAQVERGKRSLQIYDEAGDAVHKVHLEDGAAAFEALVETMRHPDQGDRLPLAPRPPAPVAEAPAGAEPLAPNVATPLLHALAAAAHPVRIAVANRGCRQTFAGPVANVVATGPWINVLDPGFNLHLREDRIARAWHKDGTVVAVDAAGVPVVAFAVESAAVARALLAGATPP